MKKGVPIIIQVAKIDWIEPHEGLFIWDVYKELPEGTTEDELDEVLADLLDDTQYFAVCDKCNKRIPVGMMNVDEIFRNERFRYICQDCMTKHYQVLF